jgi:hypothetical protein
MAYTYGTITVIILQTLSLFLLFSPPAGAYEQTDIDSWLGHARTLLSKTDSYTAIFHKQERIQQKLTEEETIFLKFRRPFNVYMKWIRHPYKGRESLFREGNNENRIKVRECGLAGFTTFDLEPNGSMIMRGSRHPVTDSGLENLVNLILENLAKGRKTGEVIVRDHGRETVYGRRTQKIELIFPKNRTKGYYSYRAELNLDLEKKLPIRALIYDWDDMLIESYGFEDVRLDAGLTEADFDPDNPEYRF